MTAKLTPAARTALTNTNGGSRQGATIPHNTPAVTVAELREAGLIGFGLGLTQSGTIARERIQTEDLDNLF
jgi:hypothetical protein